MVRTLPARSRRAHLPAGVLGQLALAEVLLAVLVLASSDGNSLVFAGSEGNAGSDVVDPVAMPTGAFADTIGGFAGPARVLVPLALPPPPEPPIPTAAPATILIPSLNVHRPVEAVGLDRAGRMYTPQNFWNAGWYKGGPVPGAPGDAVIEGHAGYPNAPLVFGRLRQLRSGDKIVVVLADGSRRLFLVDSSAIWPAGTGPPGMGEPYGPPRLTLITCTGPFDDDYKTYADRLAVEASYVGLA
jgi:LPXTG-site transpeptidase (sortase) family protein